jgi:lincosamide nucleotidyltransferase A/C/D/E
VRTVDVVEVLTALQTSPVELWIDGGWGVDALIGRETRPHKDLDLMVRSLDAERVAGVLAHLGFRLASGSGPAGLYRDDAGRRVDLSIIAPQPDGGFVHATSQGVNRYTADDLDGRGSIGGLPVRCLTASAQRRVHTGYEPRAEDAHDLRILSGAVDGRFNTVGLGGIAQDPAIPSASPFGQGYRH